MARNRIIDCADELHRAAHLFAGSLVSKLSTMGAHPSLEDDDVPPTFQNSEENLKYLGLEDTCFE